MCFALLLLCFVLLIVFPSSSSQAFDDWGEEGCGSMNHVTYERYLAFLLFGRKTRKKKLLLLFSSFLEGVYACFWISLFFLLRSLTVRRLGGFSSSWRDVFPVGLASAGFFFLPSIHLIILLSTACCLLLVER